MAKVLIVDDDVDLSQFLEIAVRRRGHEVRVATSRFEAYTVGVEFRPDVLVVDWMLGDRIDGIEVAKVLGKGRPGMKTIIITGYPSPELRRKAEGAEVWALLEKPFSVQDIRELLRRATAQDGQDVQDGQDGQDVNDPNDGHAAGAAVAAKTR